MLKARLDQFPGDILGYIHRFGHSSLFRKKTIQIFACRQASAFNERYDVNTHHHITLNSFNRVNTGQKFLDFFSHSTWYLSHMSRIVAPSVRLPRISVSTFTRVAAS